MREQTLFKQYTIREIMYELKKIKVVKMCDGKSYLTEISKRQKDINRSILRYISFSPIKIKKMLHPSKYGTSFMKN